MPLSGGKALGSPTPRLLNCTLAPFSSGFFSDESPFYQTGPNPGEGRSGNFPFAFLPENGNRMENAPKFSLYLILWLASCLLSIKQQLDEPMPGH